MPQGILNAVRAGARSVEHGSLLDDEAVELLAERDVYLVADIYDGDWIAREGRRQGRRRPSPRTTPPPRPSATASPRR